MTIEEINDFIELQLKEWPEAKRNYDALSQVKRKAVPVGDFEAWVQFNPGRIRSTGASVDKASIQARRCFLCKGNRPIEQLIHPWLPGWEFLVNPFPILPVHFTIVATDHIDQGRIPLEMASMAESTPDLLFFFNGARAGASAPDHMHCQAVLKDEVPLVKLVERLHPTSIEILSSSDMDADLPFLFYSAVIFPNDQGMRLLKAITDIAGIDKESGKADSDLLNAYFWISPEGLLRIVIIPRAAHRPSCYYASDEAKFLISPGALDMAGLIIAPREEDYDKISSKTVSEIYSEVALPI